MFWLGFLFALGLVAAVIPFIGPYRDGYLPWADCQSSACRKSQDCNEEA